MSRVHKMTGWSVSKKYADLLKKNIVAVKNPANDDAKNLLYITKKEYDNYVKTGVCPKADKERFVCGTFVVFYSKSADKATRDRIFPKEVDLDFSRKEINWGIDDDGNDDIPEKFKGVYDKDNEKQILADAQKKLPSKGVIVTHNEFFDLLTKSKYPTVTPYIQLIKDVLADKEFKPSDPVDVGELFD